MGWAEALAAIFKVIGMLIDLKAQGQLTRDKVDAALKNLEPLQPPKETE